MPVFMLPFFPSISFLFSPSATKKNYLVRKTNSTRATQISLIPAPIFLFDSRGRTDLDLVALIQRKGKKKGKEPQKKDTECRPPAWDCEPPSKGISRQNQGEERWKKKKTNTKTSLTCPCRRCCLLLLLHCRRYHPAGRQRRNCQRGSSVGPRRSRGEALPSS